MKKFFFLILPLFSIYCANIGIVSIYRKNQPYFLAIQYADDIAKRLQSLGHNVKEVVYPKDRRKLRFFDIILSTHPHLVPDYLHGRTIIYVDEPAVIYSYLQNYDYLKSFFKVFHWNHDIEDSAVFDKSFFPNFAEMHPTCKDFHDRKLVCLVNAILPRYYKKPNQLYTTRKMVAEFYNKFYPKLLTLHGGRGWNKKTMPIFQGECEDKGEVLRAHKFCYCYENWDNDNHYISEKILDCFSHRCVPIYLGSSRISDYVPKETFIDARSFSSIANIHQYISTMDEKTWMGYIDAITTYNKSKQATIFKREYYVQQILQSVDQLIEKKNIS